MKTKLSKRNKITKTSWHITYLAKNGRTLLTKANTKLIAGKKVIRLLNIGSDVITLMKYVKK